jgi:hypothetical protein
VNTDPGSSDNRCIEDEVDDDDDDDDDVIFFEDIRFDSIGVGDSILNYPCVLRDAV